MIAVFAQIETPRLRYALNLVFREVLRTKYELFTDSALFQQVEGFRLNYSILPLVAELTIEPHSLLFENDLQCFKVSYGKWFDLPVIFTNAESNFPFDMLAASFYLATRYEEYLASNADIHGRFMAEDSVAYRHGFLQLPLINQWCAQLKSAYLERHTGLHFENRAFSFVATFDIDNAWAFRNKGISRTFGGLLKAIFQGKTKERIKVFLGAEDPYDTYEYQFEIIESNRIKALYFFLLGDYGKYDTNISHTNNGLKQLIKKISNVAEIGIHPSYQSHNSFNTLKTEVNRLEQITGFEVSKSRQHFLKFTLPTTYQNLINVGITDDYSMGYASHIGFRASLCTPFNFFDLSTNSETKLRIHPLTYMDGTLCEYLNLNPEEAGLKIMELVNAVKMVNGEFISLWHNDTLNDLGKWKGWRAVFESTIKLCISDKKR